MFSKLASWLDHRTGSRKFMSVMLLEHIPGGAKWRYVWGSCLAFVFLVQLITGVLLMTAYSPGDSTAWSSVYFIQYGMDFGWLIRGLHHFGSQTMVVLIGLHMLQVVIAGAHLPPREVNWWLGLALMGAVLGLSLTGYLLPWDQKGYWATQVATSIAGNLKPSALGEWISKIIVGGPQYGHHTLTRFYALHVGILPPLVIVLTLIHIYVFRRHGVTAPQGARGEGWFWPDQVFKDLVASLVIFGIILALVVAGDGHKLEAPVEETTAGEPTLYDRWAKAGREGRGANLDAPADPSRAYPGRPEWYFLGLFQLLKYFPGDQEVMGTVVIPNAVLVVLMLLPLLSFGQKREESHRAAIPEAQAGQLLPRLASGQKREGGGVIRRALANAVGVVVVLALLTAVASLTCLALADDTVDSVPRELIQQIGTRLIPGVAVFYLAYLVLLWLLPGGAFRRLIFGLGAVALAVVLGGSGYLLAAALHGENRIPPAVAQWVERHMTTEQRKPSDEAQKFRDELASADKQAARAIQLARGGVPADGSRGLLARDPLLKGKELFQNNCASCHDHGDDFKDPKVQRKTSASDLQGFGTAEWIRDLLRDPGSPRFFGHTTLTAMASYVKRDMRNATKENKLADLETEWDMIARWLGTHPTKVSDGDPRWQAFEARCNNCHSFAGRGGEGTKGPDFTGYGSAEWLREMLMLPWHDSRYGLKNAMPGFRDLEGPSAAITQIELQDARQARLKNGDSQEQAKVDKAYRVMHLSDLDRELIIRWLLKDYRLVFGGEPVVDR